jgi:hypothetical protein
MSNTRTGQDISEVIGTHNLVEFPQQIIESVGSKNVVETTQQVVEAVGPAQIGFVGQHVVEIISSLNQVETPQNIIEVVGGFGNVRAGQIVVEVIGGLGGVRTGQNIIEVITSTPVPRPVTVQGFRGRPSSLSFGLNGYVSVPNPGAQQPLPATPINPKNVFFGPTNTRLVARYAGSQIISFADGHPSFVAPWNSIRIGADPSDRLYQVGTGEEGRLDIIAWNVYGNENYWWILAQANDVMVPFEEPYAGDRIRVPSISRILNVLGQVAAGTESQKYNQYGLVP